MKTRRTQKPTFRLRVPQGKPSVTLQEILGQPRARQVFDKLVERGVDPNKLADNLCLIPYMPFRKGSLIRGKSYKQAKYLPRRIDNFADQIDQINTRSGLLYEIALQAYASRNPRERARAQLTMASFKALPGLLRTYAVYLRIAMKQHAKESLPFQGIAIIGLLSLIDAASGQPHYEAAAKLLHAAFSAAERPVDRRLDADNLQHLYGSQPILVAAFKRNFSRN